jgi:hypothetical protein
MSTYRRTVCALLLAGLCLALPGLASSQESEKKGTNTTPPDGPKGKVTPSAKGASDLFVAQSLVQYGRKNGSPMALITAAQMFGKISPGALKEKPTRGAAKGTSDKDPKVTEADTDARALLAEAVRMAKGKEGADAIMAAAKAVGRELEDSRGATGGPKRAVDVVKARDTDSYTVSFNAGETAVVTLVGDGSTDLDLYVYDEHNNLIRSDTGPTDRAMVSWVPRWTGLFKIQVVNRGFIANKYVLITN